MLRRHAVHGHDAPAHRRHRLLVPVVERWLDLRLTDNRLRPGHLHRELGESVQGLHQLLRYGEHMSPRRRGGGRMSFLARPKAVVAITAFVLAAAAVAGALPGFGPARRTRTPGPQA